MRRLLVVLLLLALPLVAQDKREQAFQLFDRNELLQALPLLEELAKEKPDDGQVQMRLGFCRLVHSNTLTDREQRKRERARARESLETAQRLGVRDSLLSAALASLEPDGGEDTRFSENAQADEAMQRAEAAFAASKYPEARAAYQEALTFDPKLYEAALYLGQCYRIEGGHTSAQSWYERAVAIDPTRETAYRYWGNSLMRTGKPALALDKYIEAYLRQPYSRLSRNGLSEYAEERGIKLAHPHIVIPVGMEGNTIQMSVEAGSPWLSYALAHTLWRSEKWPLGRPGVPYRPSLEEEAYAIRTALEVAAESKTPLDPTLATFQKLDQAGLLEAFILLAMPGEGIVDDYAPYYEAHRDKLERYVREVVMKGGSL